MEEKLPEDQVKSVVAQWRFSVQSSGFEQRLVTALGFYERFPLDIAVTGGTKAANAKLASAVCGLKDERIEENDEQDDDEDDNDDEDEGTEEEDEDEDEDEDDDDSASVYSERKARVRIVGLADIDTDKDGEDSDCPVISHPQVPNVRVWRVQGPSAPLQHTYDVLVVLTTELHQEDHMKIAMEQSERNKPVYLVKAEEELELVRENLAGPCKTCAWERMQARTLEFQKKQKEALESASNASDHKNSSKVGLLCNGIKLWEAEEIAGVVEKAIPELRKKAFSRFLGDIASELAGPKEQRYGKGLLVSTALKMGKISQEDLDQISKTFQTRDLIDQPSKVLSVITALEYFRLDVGLLGESGCGSSSLFNSLLGLKHVDKGAAPTGVTETTKEPLSHPYPEHHNVFLWDLPGLGRVGDVKNLPPGSSLWRAPPAPSRLPTCDVYILVSPTRLSLGCVQLLQRLSSQGKACYVALSKADLIEKTSTEEVRKWSEEVLAKLGMEQNVFLVSAHQPETMDLPRMRDIINNELQSHKRLAFSNYLAKLVEENTFWKKPQPCSLM